MCLTWNSTLEWDGSTFHVPGVRTCSAAAVVSMVLIESFPSPPGHPSGVVDCATTTIARLLARATTALEREKCGRRDSNPHGLRHRHLKPACLPVPPRPPGCCRTSGRPVRIIRHLMAEEPDRDVVLEHPNRKKASSKATRAIIVLLLLVS